jgi:hypothetical protein
MVVVAQAAIEPLAVLLLCYLPTTQLPWAMAVFGRSAVKASMAEIPASLAVQFQLPQWVVEVEVMELPTTRH